MTTYLGLPLLTIRPNFDDPDLTTGRDLSFAAQGFGQVTAWSIQPNAQRTAGIPFLLMTKTDIATFTSFFESLSGQEGAFWIPTCQNAMALGVDVTTGQAVLKCADTGLGARLGQHPGYKYGCLLTSSLMEPFKISGITAGSGADAGRMIVATTAAVANSYAAAQTVVSWLLLARLQTSELDLTYETDAIATATLEVIELPREYPT